MTPQTFDQWADTVLEANQDNLIGTKDFMRMAAERTVEEVTIEPFDIALTKQNEIANQWLGKSK